MNTFFVSNNTDHLPFGLYNLLIRSVLLFRNVLIYNYTICEIFIKIVGYSFWYITNESKQQLSLFIKYINSDAIPKIWFGNVCTKLINYLMCYKQCYKNAPTIRATIQPVCFLFCLWKIVALFWANILCQRYITCAEHQILWNIVIRKEIWSISIWPANLVRVTA